jgi:hypothetical protein
LPSHGFAFCHENRLKVPVLMDSEDEVLCVGPPRLRILGIVKERAHISFVVQFSNSQKAFVVSLESIRQNYAPQLIEFYEKHTVILPYCPESAPNLPAIDLT